MNIKHMQYTKDDGSTSLRSVVVIKEPKVNYLTLDVTDLSEEELSKLSFTLKDLELYKEEVFDSVKDILKWRTFKPEGIKWL